MADHRTIVLVEDEPDLAGMFSDRLRQAGYTVYVGANGVVGFDLIKQHRPDLVLLDLVLPEIDGYSLLAKAKADAELKDIPIYAWSNLTQQDEIDRAKKLGVAEYLIKSDYTPTALVEKVSQLLSK